MDGDSQFPTICGTGTEDYSWGRGLRWRDPPTPYLGYPLYRKEPGEVPKHGSYRWHVMDLIRFKQDLKVTMQALGWWAQRQVRAPDRRYRLGGLLVPDRAARAVPGTGGARALAEVIGI